MKSMLIGVAGGLAVIAIAVGVSRMPHSSAYKTERAAIVDFDDCVALQARFDGWYRNRRDFEVGVASDAMQADYDRQKEIGCFG